MRISKQLMILIGLLAVITAGDCFAKSISVQIREGIYKEQMEGDIDGAIAIYQKVIETAAVNKRYAAEANYRIGLCMIKKGDKARAAQYFNKVMQDFADQKTVVLKTKKELSKLGVGEIPGDVPVIVGTSPEPFANDISPDLNKITVTFDRKMMDGSWSWTGGGDTYPQTAGKIHYDASRTKCTLPVKLKPGKVYWVGINSPSNKNFKTPDRKAAKWYIILFATKNAQGNPTPIPADMLERAKTINARSGASTTKKASNGKPIELLHDDGKSAGKWSLAGGGHAVRFTAAAGSTLEGVRIYGSRYGDAKAPNEDFSVWLCDTGYNPIEEFKFPYSKFAKRGYLNWVNLKTASTALPDEFIICVGFDAEQRKGVYVHHDGQSSGNSLSGLPREMEAFDKGDWMIRAIIKTATSAADSETNNSQISPQATVEAFLKAVLSKSHTESRKAKFYIDAGSALIHQLKAFPKIIKDQKLTIESVRSDSTGA
ncbi:MAG: tetratricopeptide repeat protein, partial [Anaerohalosphaera sp.]|nr:tetratricopeptide repeat protein [Anaerohalosphaera sp.]